MDLLIVSKGELAVAVALVAATLIVVAVTLVTDRVDRVGELEDLVVVHVEIVLVLQPVCPK